MSVTDETSFTMRGATGVTLQPHQILRLPRKMTIQNLREIPWKQLKCHLQCGDDSSMIRAWSEHELVISHPPVCGGSFSHFGDAFCIENYNISRSGYLPRFHQILRLPQKVTLQKHQILRLPRNMMRMIDVRHIWNRYIMYNARSKRPQPPTSPNTAHATQNDSPDWCPSHMKRYLQCAEQQASASNLTIKSCACHAKWLSWLMSVTDETSFTMRGATGVTLQPHQILRLPRKMTIQNLREIPWKQLKCHLQCGDDSSMIRAWSEHELVISHPPVCGGSFSHFGDAFCIENYNISRSGYLPRFHRILRLPQKVTLQDPQMLRLPRKMTLQDHQILRLPQKMILMIDFRHVWHVIYNARSNTNHLPTSPNTAPATPNWTDTELSCYSPVTELRLNCHWTVTELSCYWAAKLFYSELLYSELLFSELLYSELLFSELLYSELLYSELLYSELLYSELLYSELLYSELLYSELLYSELLCSELLYSELLYSELLYSEPLFSELLFSELLYSELLYSELLYSELLYSELLYSELLCSELLYSELLYSELLYSELLYSELLFSELLYSELLYSELLYSELLYSELLYSELLYSELLYSELLYSELLYSELLDCCDFKTS